MAKIKGLTSDEKSRGMCYLWKSKSESHVSMLSNSIRFMFEERPAQYYILDGEILSPEEATSSLTEVDRDRFDFIGYGQYVGSDDDKGNPDRRLLKFYKENPDKIPDFHKEIFETLTAPRKRSSK